MLLKDILKAKQEGEAVDIDVKGVDLRMVSTDRQGCIWQSTDDKLRVQVRMTFDLPSAEGKFLYDNLDVPEVSLSSKSKYDPCRRLRKGDIVTVRVRDGRIPWGTLVSGSRIHLNSGQRYIVLKDENRNDVCLDPITDITEIAHTNITVDACYIELVTPVEELDRYTVVESYGRTDIMKGDDVIATYTDNHPHAKKSAEAECASLNEERRRIYTETKPTFNN